MPRVCLVTPGKLSCNPRVVKEADALHEAGISFRIVTGILGPLPMDAEEGLLESKPWRDQVTRVAPGGASWVINRTMSKLVKKAEHLTTRSLADSCAAIRHSALTPYLTRAAVEVKADLYIGHYLAGLEAAGNASEKHGSTLGFDAEDAHHLELAGNSLEERLELGARIAIESDWLPKCRHLTAASPLIAESYLYRYKTQMDVILNVFPLSEGPQDVVADKNPVPSIYWFSQKIGPGRGIEKLLDILERMDTKMVLALRGVCTPEYQATLHQSSGKVEVQFLPPIKSDELIISASEYTLGVCLESSVPPHRDVCLTNKIFTFMAAGIPMLLSRTKAHEKIALELGNAAILLDLEDREGSMKKIGDFLTDKNSQQSAREASFRLARETYNWESEQTKFLNSVESALGSGVGNQ